MSEENLIIAKDQICLQLQDKFDCKALAPVAECETVLLSDKTNLRDCLQELLLVHKFEVLLLINAVEYKNGFQLIYQLQKMPPNYEMLILKVNLLERENPEISSITDLWESANWYERELWDLQGLKFVGHPNLKRIMNPEDWQGFPLRKRYIPPLDALNGPITAVKGDQIGKLAKSTRQEVEIIQELPSPENSSSGSMA